MREKALEAFDADGDGKLDGKEREQMKKSMHQKALEKFDADGDGKLCEEERKSARAARPGAGRRGPPKGPGRR
jgi:Ca2+-binding EF-hand superfamily protein